MSELSMNHLWGDSFVYEYVYGVTIFSMTRLYKESIIYDCLWSDSIVYIEKVLSMTVYGATVLSI